MAKHTSVGIPLAGNPDRVSNSLLEIPITFEADAADGSIDLSDLSELENVTGHFVRIGYVEDGVTPPDALYASIKDKNGVEVLGNTASALETGKPKFSENAIPVPFVRGLVVALTGNETVSAKGTLWLYVMQVIQ